MTDLVRQLHEEHVQVNRVLDLLAMEIAVFRNGDVPDYHLIQEIVDYCLDFPETCHRPKEEAIYALLVERAPLLKAAVFDLAAAHERMEILTRRLYETVDRIMRDETMSRDRFADIATSYVEGYRSHMRTEEETFFPEALRQLADGDWAQLEDRIFFSGDPLAHQSSERRFATLRNGILRNA